jgi:DNA-binding CsgD family transcriptional regulator
VVDVLRARCDRRTVDLDEVRELVATLSDIQRVGGVAAVSAEIAWLEGANDTELLADAVALARDSGHQRYVAELEVWRRRLGLAPDPTVTEGPPPLRLELERRWTDAAAAWSTLGCPYDRALSLAFSGDVDAMQEAALIVRSLGAVRTADRIRQMLREAGVMVASGPRAATRANPAGLTNRQVEVAELLVQGLTNAEIAGALFLSEKTVDHHVSAVLGKLGATNRRDAAQRFAALSAGDALS